MRLGPFELGEQIGAGRDGVAFRARSDRDGSACELLDLGSARRDPARWSSLSRRLRLAATLSHPALIRLSDLAIDSDAPYAALQGTRDADLIAWVREHGVPDPRQARRLVRSLAEGIAAAHRAGLIHGQIAPGVVWMDGQGQPLLDISGAEVLPADPDPQRRELADRCQAPEVRAGFAPGKPADVYALGGLLAWLLDPHGPADLAETLRRTAGIESVPVATALDPDPDERPTAAEFAAGLADGNAGRFEATGEWGRTVDLTGEAADRSAETLMLAEPGPPPVSPEPRALGRFEILALLGEGGQGAVYRARDNVSGAVVALKVLRPDRSGQSQSLKRFRKEARLMAESNNPWVVNLLEFNEDGGVPYLVLEYVAGKSLADLLVERGPIDEAAALEVMADVARALAAPHDRGIIHRDVKPANILLIDGEADDHVPQGETLAMPNPSTMDPARPAGLLPSYRVKLSDFGLARHLVDSQSLALTEAGALLGTPHYMAPEQWQGLATDPRTDVYAMGATLFQLLAGRPPFQAETRDALLNLHCNEPAPSLRRLRPEVSEGIAGVVERALAKRPEDRHADASALLHDLEALRLGTPAALAVHPHLPAGNSRDVIAFDWEWDLESSPRDLWPHVSNTERVNRALGLPAAEFTTRPAPQGGVERHGRFHKVVPFAWLEHPFEWVEGQRFGVLREFQQGVFRWFVSQVELQPRGHGTRLIHRIRVEPRGLGGRLMAHLQLARGGRRSLERVYRRIDAVLSGKLSQAGIIDPFEEPPPLAQDRRSRLEDALDRLIREGSDPVAVERLGAFLGQAPDPEVARIRPLELAERLELGPDRLIEACLKGARGGLLVLLWDLLCPVCRIPSEIKDTLRAIGDHGHCPACNLDYPLDFASSVELIFRVHPEIRAVDLGTYCIGGPAHSPHVLAQVRVAPGERLELPLELSPGSYRILGPQLPWSADFQVAPSAGVRLWEIDLASGPRSEDPRSFRSGSPVLTLTNPLGHELLVRIERTASRGDALTAAEAAAMALFRELFPAEILAPGQLAAVSTVTLMAVVLEPIQADALYRERGDAAAFHVLQALYGCVQDAVREAGGAVVRTIGEGLLAAFPDPASAVRVGLELSRKLASGEATRDLRLQAAIHRGTALAATVNDHLDYFGTTVRQVLKMPSLVPPGELGLGPAVAADPEVAAILHDRGLEPTPLALEDRSLGYILRVRL